MTHPLLDSVIKLTMMRIARTGLLKIARKNFIRLEICFSFLFFFFCVCLYYFEFFNSLLMSCTNIFVSGIIHSRIIVHIDMDCFFASVVLRNRPDLKETPVAVAHSDHGSSEVSAANYKAREFGIHSGMFMSTAKSLCANLTVLPYDFEAFEKVSLTLYSILFEWSAQVQV